jgi:hypothetical protein
MKQIRILLIGLILLFSNAASQAQDNITLANKKSQLALNCAFGAGTFAAGKNMDGSSFLGTSLSADWKPDANAAFSYGLETGLLGGETESSKIYGIPAIFRLGWYPEISKNEKLDIFILMKAGWAYGIWGSQKPEGSSPTGIVGGFNFGGRYYLTPLLDFYTELGYNYYGLAHTSGHPLGYGSGKTYASVGLSLKIGKN